MATAVKKAPKSQYSQSDIMTTLGASSAPHFEIGGDSFTEKEGIIFNNNYMPTGVAVPVDYLPADSRNRLKCPMLILLNADARFNDLAGNVRSDLGMPSISIICLLKLRGMLPDGDDDPTNDNVAKAMRMLTSGEIRVIDFVPDRHIALSKEERRWLDAKTPEIRHKLKPPEAGFTVVNGNWHRPATVLLYDVAKKKYYLSGQDDGQYFGVQLPAGKDDVVLKSIADAFHALTPEEAQGVAGAKRQGEWFMVPLGKEFSPQQPYPYIASCVLPKEDPKSNDHDLSADDIVIGADGTVYARNPCLDHDQHLSLNATGWHAFYRNTAERSVSVEGVD